MRYVMREKLWSFGDDFKVAQVSKRFFSWSDTYGIDIADGEDDITILATAVVIDLVCHADEKS